MRKAAFAVISALQENRIFDLADPMNKDNCHYCFFALKEELRKRGIDLSTQDVNGLDDAEFVIFSEMPAVMPAKRPGQRFYLLAIESIAVHPKNFDLGLYAHFDKVFTWRDDIVDGRFIIKINYSFLFNPIFDLDLSVKKKLACLIGNNKGSRHPGELYSKRVEIIEWFARNHPDAFDLYGNGWDQWFISPLAVRIVRKLGLDSRLKRRRYEFHRGIANPKIPLLRNYRFNLCLENVKGIPGYITEKIFDCFFAGCVPVYLGANNILDYIPKGCFVDMRDFGSLDELYGFMARMDDQTYLGYLRSIKDYLASAQAVQFSAQHFAKTVADVVALAASAAAA